MGASSDSTTEYLEDVKCFSNSEVKTCPTVSFGNELRERIQGEIMEWGPGLVPHGAGVGGQS